MNKDTIDLKKYCFTENILVLKAMYDKRNSDEMVYVTQNEIADELTMQPLKVNRIIKLLKEDNLLESIKDKKARYKITSEGIELIESIQSIF